MSNYSTESLLINLQRTVKHLEDSIKEKNKEIENLKILVFKLQESIEMIRAIQHGFKVRMVPSDFISNSVDTEKDRVMVEEIMKSDEVYLKHFKD